MRIPVWGLLLLILSFKATGISAQTPLTEYYTFEKDSGKYTTIDTSKMVSISDWDVWVEDDVYDVPVPFKFRFLDHDLTSLKVNQTNLFLPERNYFLATFGNFLMYDLANKDTLLSEGLSPISYIIDQTPKGKIMKIQWLNAGFFFDSTMFLNVQVWLYENSNNIEIHYGTSHIDLMKSQVIGCGPLVGLARVDTVAGNDLYEYFLRGNATDPTAVKLSVAGKKCLNDVPPEGTIYRFVFHDSAKTVEHYPNAYLVYPNPTHGELNVNLTGPGPYTIEVYDVYGSRVYSAPIKFGDKVDLTGLKNGIYIVNISEEALVYTQKIMIAR